MPYQVLTRDEHFQNGGPKRILALDGGGLKGILTLGFLRRIETILRERYGNDENFRLCHYFDLIAGTSTGSIIAASLALGMGVEELIGHYDRLGREVFKKDLLRPGVIRSKYDEAKLIENLKVVLGANRTIGDPSLKTGLLVMTKRLDTGSPWPVGNNPRGRYFQAGATDKWISNGEYPLWKIVRASTAAPSYFDPEPITIASEPGKKDVTGTFVDGGVSPFNNPALQAVMYATLEGYKVGWKTGAEQLLVVSVGTGSADPSKTPSRIAAVGAIKALTSLMDDCSSLVELVMQWMSQSPTAGVIDREVGDLKHDLIAGAPLLSYLRYNVALSETEVGALHPGLSAQQVASLGEMDNPDNLDLLLELGEAAAAKKVQATDFGRVFDL